MLAAVGAQSHKPDDGFKTDQLACWISTYSKTGPEGHVATGETTPLHSQTTSQLPPRREHRP